MNSSSLTRRAEQVHRNTIRQDWQQYREILLRADDSPQQDDEHRLGELMRRLPITAQDIDHDLQTIRQDRKQQAAIEKTQQQQAQARPAEDIRKAIDEQDEKIRKTIAPLLAHKLELVRELRRIEGQAAQLHHQQNQAEDTRRMAARIFGDLEHMHQDRPA